MKSCPECGALTPCKKCAGVTCLQPHICHGPTCWVCEDEEPEGCPDCSEFSRCPACEDDYQHDKHKDDE